MAVCYEITGLHKVWIFEFGFNSSQKFDDTAVFM